MPRFAANLSTMFTEHAFLDRFAAAADAGFAAVEFLFPYDHPPDAIARRLHDAGLEIALFNLPPGNWEAGDRGLAALPGREADFAATLTRALPHVEAIQPQRLHMMAGIPPDRACPQTCRATYIANLRRAADRLSGFGVTVLVEPINRRDMPGYFVSHQQQAIDLINCCGAATVALQMDLYHCQIVEGDLATRIRRHFDRIGHIQIAGVPDRHEPDSGEINHRYLFDLLDDLGYGGWIGCEYRPRAGTTDGLGWLAGLA